MAVKTPETHTALVRRARKINRVLAETYPDAHCELDFANPFQLLVATVLSAQTTDKRVNLTTPVLFAKYPTPEDLAAANPEEVAEILKPTGFFNAKTKSVMGLSAALVERFGGAQLHKRTFRPAADRTADVGLRGGPASARQDEFGQPWQGGIVMGQPVVELGHLGCLEQGIARDGEFTTQVKQVVLDMEQRGADVLGQIRFGQQQADGAVQFVHVAQRGDARRVLGRAGPVAQAGGAVVSRAGGNDR